MKVEVYSDIACPWCYIGKHRFDRALAAFPAGDTVDVVYRPYQLDPGAPAQASSHRAYLDSRFGPGSAAMDAKVARLGEGEGIAFEFDRALHVNTLNGHRLLRLAELEYGHGTQARLQEKLFAARFANGGDVGDLDQLADLAAEVGIDRPRAAAYLASDEGEKEVRAQIDEARALGVTSVPTFVFEGTWAVSGAQETSTFLRVLEQVALEMGTESAESRSESGASDGDGCTDESCAV
ncbi:MAG TPA: DsbA family oxidoreductase [Actinocrinis sp.]|nr:DsbA family oxidoreductase [Actinocrinis sp.]